MLLVSIANGAVRALVYGGYMSKPAAHQIATVIGILLFGMLIRAFVHRFPVCLQLVCHFH